MSALLKSAVFVASVAGQDSYDAEAGLPAQYLPVQNQGGCGSCWSFSATEMLSQRILKTAEASVFESWGALVSPQVPVSFPQYSGGMGCNGGWPYKVGSMVQGQGGLPDLHCAPYLSGSGCGEGQDTSHNGCHPENWKSCWGSTPTWQGWGWMQGAVVRQVKQLQGEADYKSDIMQNGDLSVAFNFYREFQSYRGGVMTHATPDKGGHAVLITGWGTEGVPYWKVRNSWGGNWGEYGYCRMLRGQNFQNIESTGASFGLGASVAANVTAEFVPPEGVDMPGGWVERSGEEEPVIEAVAALREHWKERHFDLLHAKSQVVEGMHVKLTVRTGSLEWRALAHKAPIYRDSNDLPGFRIVHVGEVRDDVVV